MKKLLLSFSILLSSLSSTAYTIQDILQGQDEVQAYEVFFDLLTTTNGAKHAKTNITTWKKSPTKPTSRIILTKFDGDATIEYVFKLVNARGTETTNGTMLRYTVDSSSSRGILSGHIESDYYNAYAYWNDTTADFKLVKDPASGLITAMDPNMVGLKTSSSQSKPTKGYQNAYYLFAPTNATGSHTLTTYTVYSNSYSFNTPYDAQYQAYFDIDEESKTFRMLNLGNVGGAMFLSGSLYGAGYVTGTVDPETKTLTFTEDQMGYFQSDVIGTYWLDYDFRLKRIAGTYTEVYSDLTATYKRDDNPKHNDAANGWVTNGGSRRTTLGLEINFSDPFTFAYNQMLYSQVNFDKVYSNTVLRKEEDVTLDAEVILEKYNSENGVVYVSGQILLNKNLEYLASDGGLDLFIVPGNYTDISEFAENIDSENGHSSATNISDEMYNSNAEGTPRSAAPATYGLGEVKTTSEGQLYIPFKKAIAEKELNAASSENKYSVFLRARYENSDLTPTFHSLTYMAEPNVTGLDNLIATDSEVPAEYFNLQGQPVNPEALTPGLYLCRRGNTTTKLLVR